jgi:hypothetical protein
MNQHCHATGSADFTYSSGLLWQILPWTGVNLFLQVWLSGFVGKSLVREGYLPKKF